MAVPNTLTTDLAPTTQYAYTKKALERLTPVLVFYKAFQSDPESYRLPETGGRTAVFYRYANLAVNTSALDQVSAGDGVTVSRSEIEVPVAEYGTFTLVPGLVKRTDIDPQVMKNIEEVIADNAGLSLDTICRDKISDTAQVAYANKSAVGTIDSDDVLKFNDIAMQIARLTGDNVKPYDDGFFKVVLHPHQALDLSSEASTPTGNATLRGLLAYDNASDLEAMMKPDYQSGLIGKYGNMKFVQTSLAKSAVVNSINTREAYVMGRGGYGAVNISDAKTGFKVQVNYASSNQITDPYNRHATVSWYVPAFGAGSLDKSKAGDKNARAVKIISATQLD